MKEMCQFTNGFLDDRKIFGPPISKGQHFKSERIVICLRLEKGYMGRATQKTCLRAYADSEGTDQPAHPRTLTRAFTFR